MSVSHVIFLVRALKKLFSVRKIGLGTWAKEGAEQGKKKDVGGGAFGITAEW